MDAFAQTRTWRRARHLGLTGLLCLGRHTISNLLCTGGQQFADWSAAYRLFSQDRWEPGALFATVLAGVLERLSASQPLVVAMDDTLVRKTGWKAKGVAWRRDPLSPPFRCNFVPAQRFLQAAAVLAAPAEPEAVRCIPVAYEHVPPVPRPRRSAPPEAWQAYRRRRRQENLSTRAVALLQRLRQQADAQPQPRPMVAVVDGGYMNQTVLRGLPRDTTLIGRVRKDLKLYAPPPASGATGAGRRRRYGAPLPTPEAWRKDDAAPWITVRAFATGRWHDFRIKTFGPVGWKKAGWQRPVQVLIIAPLGYRLRQRRRRLYRQPAYLLSTDIQLPPPQILQDYLWRWDIEVNHRDEKQLVGVGQAQLTNVLAVDRQPAFAVFSYALLLLAATDAYAEGRHGRLPPPKWRVGGPPRRMSTPQILQELRKEVWAYALGDLQNFDHFMRAVTPPTKSLELPASLPSAVLYGAVA